MKNFLHFLLRVLGTHRPTGLQSPLSLSQRRAGNVSQEGSRAALEKEGAHGGLSRSPCLHLEELCSQPEEEAILGHSGSGLHPGHSTFIPC